MTANERPMSGPDRVLTDGFPDGWFLEDRPGAGEALLCRRSELAFGGVVCVCLRPRATPTEQWVLTARSSPTGSRWRTGGAVKRRISARAAEPGP